MSSTVDNHAMENPTTPQNVAERQSVRELDRVFAAWTVENFCESDNEAHRDVVLRIATAVSYALHLKHSCIDLASYQSLNDPVLEGLLDGIDPTSLGGFTDAAISVEGPDMSYVPLVRSENGRLIWMQKYYAFEQAVGKRIKQMAAHKTRLFDAQMTSLNRLYPETDADSQRDAVATALTNRFCVITGGPGTGKTWTVARIIALISAHGLGGKENPRIALAAPTGKAANRMYESLHEAATDTKLQQLGGDQETLDKARTLHSLLGIRRGSPKPGFHAANPLAVDVLIVDEASMVDLPMMYRILDALPEHAHLILLGDKDQLASVEAGSVLGELCSNDSATGFATIQSCIGTLTKNYRSEDARGIIEFAQAINQGRLSDSTDNQHLTLVEQNLGIDPWNPGWLNQAAQAFTTFHEYTQDGKDAIEVLKHQNDFQILCGLRNGPVGVMGINSMIERKLSRKSGDWYAGLPVMVTANDHDRQLFNGDVGSVLPVVEIDGKWVIDHQRGDLKACFSAGAQDGSVKAISLAQMPSYETCYAMTVHKSQGSEYKRVLFVLPLSRVDVASNPVMTRELIYTGITRAKQEVSIWSAAGVLESVVAKRSVRMSGLGHDSKGTFP